MKIFGIMLVKNEADIVGYVLKKASEWCDKIFILDNGSTDGTWEICQSMANECITPWKQYFGDYHNGLRADVYNEFKHLSEPGDWWCYKLDADEVYAEDPRDFLAKVPKRYQWVGKRDIAYCVTKEDAEEYEFTGEFEHDKDFLKYFTVPCWSEGRFFRYRKNLKWENTWNSHYPPHVGVMYDDYIVVFHYRERSPQQVQRRNELRKSTKVHKEGRAWRLQKDELPYRTTLAFDDCNISNVKKYPVDTGKFKQSLFKKIIKIILIRLKLYN